MTRVALTKLFILVILAFIICIPEFFSSYRVSKVSFLCLPYQPCEQGNEVYGETDGAVIRRKDLCDPAQTEEHEKLEQACAQENQSNTTEDSWFMCQTDTDMVELHSNILTSALKVHLEVSVVFQLDHTETLNLIFYGQSNFSSLHLHPPEEVEEQKKAGDEEQNEALYCCFPVLPTSESSNQSHCLLWLANQTILTTTAREKLPWKWTQTGEWRCVLRVLWLALLCVVLLTIVTTVIGQIYWKNRSGKNPKVRPLDYDFTGQQLNDGEKYIEVTSTGPIAQSYEARHWSGLSPIQESATEEDTETLLDGNVDNCYTGVYHRRKKMPKRTPCTFLYTTPRLGPSARLPVTFYHMYGAVVNKWLERQACNRKQICTIEAIRPPDCCQKSRPGDKREQPDQR